MDTSSHLPMSSYERLYKKRMGKCVKNSPERPVEDNTCHGARRGAILMKVAGGAEELQAGESAGMKMCDTLTHYINGNRAALFEWLDANPR